MLALLEQIEDRLDDLLDQLDGLMEASERAEFQAETARLFTAEPVEPPTLH